MKSKKYIKVSTVFCFDCAGESWLLYVYSDRLVVAHKNKDYLPAKISCDPDGRWFCDPCVPGFPSEEIENFLNEHRVPL